MVSTCLMLLPGVKELSDFHAASMVQQLQQMPSLSASLQAPTELQVLVCGAAPPAAVMGGVEGPCSSVAAVRQQPVPAQRVCCGCLAQAPCNLSSSLGVHINCLFGLHMLAWLHRCLKLSIVLQLNFDVNASQVCVSTAAQMTSDMPVAQPQYPAAVQVYPVC